MARYSDIIRGTQLAAAYVKLQAYRAQSEVAQQADYAGVAKPVTARVKSERIDAYISPFNSDSAVVWYECKVLAASQTGPGSATGNIIEGLVTDRNKLTLTGTEEGFPARKYKFAKIIGSKRTDTATTNSNSRLTGTAYKRHRSDNVSCNFGKKTAAAETYNDAVKEIRAKAAFATFEGDAGSRIGFKAEG